MLAKTREMERNRANETLKDPFYSQNPWAYERSRLLSATHPSLSNRWHPTGTTFDLRAVPRGPGDQILPVSRPSVSTRTSPSLMTETCPPNDYRSHGYMPMAYPNKCRHRISSRICPVQSHYSTRAKNWGAPVLDWPIL